MTTRSSSTTRALPLALVLAVLAAAPAVAQTNGEATAGTQRLRNGARLQASTWQPDKPAGFENMETIAFQ